MITIDIDISKLGSTFSDFDNSFSKNIRNNKEIFEILSKINNVWEDSNTEAFINKLNHDNNKIEQYNLDTKKTAEAVSNFINSISQVSDKCNMGKAQKIRYVGHNTKTIYNNCFSIANILYSIKSNLDYMQIPSSYIYKNQLYNWKLQLFNLAEEIKAIGNLFLDISNGFENSVRTLDECSTTKETLSLTKLVYNSSTNVASLTDSNDVVRSAKNKQTMTKSKVGLIYNEEKSNFTHNEKFKHAKSETNEFKEKESSFSHNETLKNANKKINEFKEQSSNYTNSESRVNAQMNEINIEAENSFVNNAKKVDNNQNAFVYEQKNDFKNSTNSVSANSSEINTKTDISFQNTLDETEKVNQNIDLNKTNININSPKKVETLNETIDFE